jgi:hypothetical protein
MWLWTQYANAIPSDVAVTEHDPCTNTSRQHQGTRDHVAIAAQLVIMGYTAATPLGWPLLESQELVLQVGILARALLSAALYI